MSSKKNALKFQGIYLQAKKEQSIQLLIALVPLMWF